MYYKISVVIFLVAVIYLAGAAPAKRTTTEQLFGILSWNSGQFVAVTSNGGLYASSSSQNPAAQFTRRTTNNLYTFESVYLSGQFVLFENGELLVGTPSDNNDQFLELQTPDPSHMALKMNNSPPDCYMAFNTYGNVHSNICHSSLNTSDIATHFSLVPL